MQNLLIIFGAKYLIAAIVLISIYFFWKQSKPARKQILIFAAIVLPVSYVAAKISSLFYFDARPFVVENFVPLIEHARDNGFPSDHTLLGGALAAVTFFFNRKVGTILFVLTVLMGASRVLAGVHHAVDIIGSLLITAIVASIANRFVLNKQRKNG